VRTQAIHLAFGNAAVKAKYLLHSKLRLAVCSFQKLILIKYDTLRHTHMYVYVRRYVDLWEVIRHIGRYQSPSWTTRPEPLRAKFLRDVSGSVEVLRRRPHPQGHSHDEDTVSEFGNLEFNLIDMLRAKFHELRSETCHHLVLVYLCVEGTLCLTARIWNRRRLQTLGIITTDILYYVNITYDR
jgi:hypothetical protein